jgi:hypothetical protein
MAIAYDNALQTVVSVGVTSVTRSLTTSGSNRFLVSWALTTNATDMSGVTYNGVSLTKAGEVNQDAFSTECHYLINPTSGANNMVWSQGTSTTFVTTAVSYTGVNQSFTPVTDTDSDYSGNLTLDASFTTTVDNSWIIWNIRNPGSDPNASGTNFVTRAVGTDNGIYVGDTNGAITPAGATSMSVTMDQTWNNDLFNMQIEPAPSTSIKTINGLAIASVKTVNGLSIASVKTVNGLA